MQENTLKVKLYKELKGDGFEILKGAVKNFWQKWGVQVQKEK